MVQRVATVAFEGIEARAVDVQVQVAAGLPAFIVVGLPDKSVTEARQRVRSALIASGLALPARRITVNLAPADLPKEGSHYDLPIALGLMAAMGAIPADALSGFTVLGELALDGSIAPVAGVLPAAIGANSRREGLICPAACGPEAAWASPEMEIARRTQVFQGTQIWVENADYVSGGVAENGSFILLDVPPGNVTIGFSAPGVDRAKIVMTNIPGSADVFIPRVILKPNGASVVKPESVVVRIASPEIKKPAPTGKTATVAGLTVPIMNVPLSAMVDRHDYPVPEGFRPLVVVK